MGVAPWMKCRATTVAKPPAATSSVPSATSRQSVKWNTTDAASASEISNKNVKKNSVQRHSSRKHDSMASMHFWVEFSGAWLEEASWVDKSKRAKNPQTIRYKRSTQMKLKMKKTPIWLMNGKYFWCHLVFRGGGRRRFRRRSRAASFWRRVSVHGGPWAQTADSAECPEQSDPSLIFFHFFHFHWYRFSSIAVHLTIRYRFWARSSSLTEKQQIPHS